MAQKRELVHIKLSRQCRWSLVQSYSQQCNRAGGDQRPQTVSRVTVSILLHACMGDSQSHTLRYVLQDILLFSLHALTQRAYTTQMLSSLRKQTKEVLELSGKASGAWTVPCCVDSLAPLAPCLNHTKHKVVCHDSCSVMFYCSEKVMLGLFLSS